MPMTYRLSGPYGIASRSQRNLFRHSRISHLVQLVVRRVTFPLPSVRLGVCTIKHRNKRPKALEAWRVAIRHTIWIVRMMKHPMWRLQDRACLRQAVWGGERLFLTGHLRISYRHFKYQ